MLPLCCGFKIKIVSWLSLLFPWAAIKSILTFQQSDHSLAYIFAFLRTNPGFSNTFFAGVCNQDISFHPYQSNIINHNRNVRRSLLILVILSFFAKPVCWCSIFSEQSSHRLRLTKLLTPDFRWNVKTFVQSCFLCGCEVCPLISIPIGCLQSMLFNLIFILKKKTQEYFLHRGSDRKTCLDFLIKGIWNT